MPIRSFFSLQDRLLPCFEEMNQAMNPTRDDSLAQRRPTLRDRRLLRTPVPGAITKRRRLPPLEKKRCGSVQAESVRMSRSCASRAATRTIRRIVVLMFDAKLRGQTSRLEEQDDRKRYASGRRGAGLLSLYKRRAAPHALPSSLNHWNHQ